AGGATLLAVIVGERHAFVGDAVDVRRPVAHHAPAEVADVPGADVIAPEDQEIGLLGCHLFVFSLRSVELAGYAPEDASESKVRHAGVDHLRLPRRRTVPEAVIRRAQVGASFDD